jgi:PAS domain S-box-containing protein
MATDDSRLKSSRVAGLWMKAALFGLAYFFCAEAGNYLSPRGGTIVTFWLPGGLFLAVLLLNRTRDWPCLVLAALSANFIFDHFYGTKFVVIVAFFCANTVQALTGAWLVRKFVADRPALATLKEFIGLLGFAAVFSAMLGAFIGATTLVHFGFSQSFEQSWKVWWGSNAMAILLLTPFILTWFSKPPRARNKFGSPKKIAEAVLLLLALIIYVWVLLFLGHGLMSTNRTWAIPLLLWAGLRFGRRGATSVSLLLSLLTAFFTTQYAIGLNGAEIPTGQYIFPMQAVLAMASLVALVPAIVIGERNRTLAELRESEERFKNLSSAAFEGIFISENGRILDVNDQGLKMFGYERNEMIGRKIIELVAPESRELVAEAIRAGRETIYGHQLLHKDGSVFFAEAQARMVRAGNQTLRMTALRDITERKQAEEALRKSEALFRSYFELAMVGCAISSLEKDVVAVNDQFCRMVGYSRDELHHMTWTQLTHPDDVADDVAQFNRVLAGEINAYTLDKRYIRKDGREVFVTLSVRCVRHPDGSPDYFVALVMDITERKSVEQALRESEEKFSKAFQSNPNGICITEMETGRYIEVNESFCKVFGYSHEEMIGHTALELGVWKNKADRERLIQPLLKGDVVRDFQMETRDRNNQMKILMVSAELIELGGEKCLVSMLHDITDRKRAEAERAEAQTREAQARVEYTFQLIASQEAERARIAAELHDSLGQNLLLIKNRAQLALSKESTRAALREQMEGINELAAQTIAEVRQISRDLHPHQLDHLGLTRAIEAMIDSAAQASGLELKHKLDSVDDVFPKDAAMNLYRVVQESLNNILKHSHAKHASITLEHDVHEVLLRIEDDGCGFKTGKSEKSGKGLGLKNIAERVRMLGGKLAIDSQPGKGARVEVTIPISDGEQAI